MNNYRINSEAFLSYARIFIINISLSLLGQTAPLMSILQFSSNAWYSIKRWMTDWLWGTEDLEYMLVFIWLYDFSTFSFMCFSCHWLWVYSCHSGWQQAGDQVFCIAAWCIYSTAFDIGSMTYSVACWLNILSHLKKGWQKSQKI